MSAVVSNSARLGALLATILMLVACTPAAIAPVVEQGRFKEPLPGKTVVAGYFELTNPTQARWLLTAVTADLGSSVEMHQTVRNGDQVRMQRIQEIALAPGERVSFAPGGYHLMLFGIDGPSPATRVTLHFEGGATVTATFGSEPW